MREIDITIGSVSATGFIGDGRQRTAADICVTVTTDGNLKMEGGRRAAANDAIVAELDTQQRRALRDALDESLGK